MARHLGIVSVLSAGLVMLIYLNYAPGSWNARAESSFEDLALTHTYNVASGEATSRADEFFYRIFRQRYKKNLVDIESILTKTDNTFSGSVDQNRIPYEDFWFPESAGGTEGPIRGGDESSATKALSQYDKAFYGGTSTALKWEQENHSERSPSWYGHCNGYSAAASRHQNPGGQEFKSVQRPENCSGSQCVEFTPAMIRALLAEVYMNARSQFVGGYRCEVSADELNTREAYENRLNPETLNECQDVDPGAFHLAMTNWIGWKKQVIIADVNRDVEVWNYPVYRIEFEYEFKNSRKLWTAEEALQETRSTRYQTYAFNPEATKFAVVNFRMYYAKASDNTDLNPESALAPKLIYRRLRYILELDDDLNVLGGEWLGWINPNSGAYEPGAKVSHPDFIWVPFAPTPPSGNRTGANPFVDASRVISLWAEAKGFDPENPFSDPNPHIILEAPKDQEVWGEVASWYTLTLDDSQTGAAFRGFPQYLVLTPDYNLKNSYQLKVTLNQEVVMDQTYDPKAPLELNINPKPGINRVQFSFLDEGEVVDGPSQTILFYAL